MLRALVRLSVVLTSACLLAGCVSLGLHETARTTPTGKFEFGGIVTPIIVLFAEDEGAGVVFPIPEMYARLGLSDNSDLGFRWAFGPGVGVDYKHRLASGGVDVAARLGGSFYGLFFGGEGVGYYSLSPRIIFSKEPVSGTPWAFNAGLDYIGVFGSGMDGSSGGSLLRAGFGLPFRAFESKVRIMPEISIILPLATGDAFGDDELLLGRGGLLSLGFSLGNVAQ